MRARLFDAADMFVRDVEVPDSEGVIPDILTVDDYSYMRIGFDGNEARYKLAVGRQTVHTEPVPIYLARMFEQPVLFETKQIRLFSGCHGAATFFYEQNIKLAWNTRSILQFRGLTGVRINGVWCPDVPRMPGKIQEGAFLHDQATRSLRFMKALLKGPGKTAWRDPMQFSAVGVDEYGRLVCDVRVREKYVFDGSDGVRSIAPAALESGLFSPTRLITE